MVGDRTPPCPAPKTRRAQRRARPAYLLEYRAARIGGTLYCVGAPGSFG
jgi:hypothetical protein